MKKHKFKKGTLVRILTEKEIEKLGFIKYKIDRHIFLIDNKATIIDQMRKYLGKMYAISNITRDGELLNYQLDDTGPWYWDEAILEILDTKAAKILYEEK